MPMDKNNSIGVVDARNYDIVISYLKSHDKFDEKLILNKLRARVCNKI